MTTKNGSAASAEKVDPTVDEIRAEADDRAHDRLSPDAVLDGMTAVDLYAEAFLEGARFATGRPR